MLIPNYWWNGSAYFLEHIEHFLSFIVVDEAIAKDPTPSRCWISLLFSYHKEIDNPPKFDLLTSDPWWPDRIEAAVKTKSIARPRSILILESVRAEAGKHVEAKRAYCFSPPFHSYL